MERQGYDVSYTRRRPGGRNGAELRQHKIIVISGHSEYWSLEEFNGCKAARERRREHRLASARNTAYWKVRYEDGGRTLVCYKTVQGDGSGGSGQISPNDWGPDGIAGTADDALGLDGIAGTADDHPENATTTFRDNGAPTGDPNAPPGGRVGPDMPENQLFGVMYVGDNDSQFFPLTVPAEKRERRVLRRPDLAQHGHLARTRRRTSARTSSAGNGTRSRPRPSTLATAQRRQAAHEHERPDRDRQQLAPRRGPAARHESAAAASPAR